jgi:hypothetical protein
VCAFVVVRGIDARADERDRNVGAGAPEGLAVGSVERVDVGLVCDLVSVGDEAQLRAEPMVIRPAAVLEAGVG